VVTLIVLGGGTGTPKLLAGLKELLDPSELTVVVNTADDLWISGNLVSPDLDTVMYTLAGMIDEVRWWGIRGDSFQTAEFLRRMCHSEMLALGDMDRAVHIFRSEQIRKGATLSSATEALADVLGVAQNVIPMTDEPVSTIITTPLGDMHLQEFWVGHGGRPEVMSLRLVGIESAKPSESFLDVLTGNEPILIGPSNPVTSVGPILALKGVRQLLADKKVIAISPLIDDRPVSGPAEKFMNAMGIPVTDQGIADYLGCVDLFVVSEGSGYSGRCSRQDTFMNCREDSIALSRRIIELISCL
jgi:LPPG:FO 2-phospho-L-lactate transferase